MSELQEFEYIADISVSARPMAKRNECDEVRFPSVEICKPFFFILLLPRGRSEAVWCYPEALNRREGGVCLTGRLDDMACA